MKFIWAALGIYAAQWASLPFIDDQWGFVVVSQLVIIALLVTGAFRLLYGESVLVRSVLALWSIGAWGDVASGTAWNYFGMYVDMSASSALVFAVWLIFIVRRKYDTKNDTIYADSVVLLVKRPVTGWDMVKSLFGAPAPSLCVSIGGIVWAFRKRTGVFEMLPMTDRMRASHTAINTGMRSTPDIIAQLGRMVGTPRGIIPCRCVWTIRNVLQQIGGKYAIKSWFDYVPAIYVMRIL